GKSVTALSLMRLVPDPPGRIVAGSIRLDEVDILALEDDELRAMRGRDISMIFQEPMTSLNPVMTIGRQLGEVLQLHQPLTVAQTAQRVIVMYAGRKVEEAQVEALFADPQHQYTRGLLASLPRLGLLRGEAAANGRLQEIPGIVPALNNLPPGCAFAPRCPRADERRRSETPAYEEKRPGHWAACWHPGATNGRGDD